MARVQVLPDVLVNQIAAGEVVERPASVVKELVENSLDAGATRVDVEIEGGGVLRVSVSDDGCGLSPEDARMALERHATSKIRSLEDLARIATLGFRGEALPSIASVSRFRLLSAEDASGLGTEVLVERGAPPVVRPARSPKGTRIVVEDLFGNVPARRKFLKSPEAETRAVVRAATAQALARPDLAFTLSSGARKLLELPSVAGVSERFVELLGSSVAGEVLSVDWKGLGLTLHGVVTRPDVSFASRTHQWLFVNGRPARDGSVSHAAQMAAEEVLRNDRHPAWALFLTCDPSFCDVNVHPQKLEVRFRDPGTVHSAVHRALVATLGRGKSAVALSAESFRPSTGPGSWTAPALPRPFGQPAAVSTVAESLGLYGRSEEPAVSSSPASYGGRVAPSPIGTLRLLGQYRSSFLLAEGDDGLVLVDQHVAHERVRYERIRRRLLSNQPASQQLLLPVVFEASPEESAVLAGSEPLLSSAGFVISEASGRSFLVSSTPPECGAGAVVPFLRDFLGAVLELPEPERTAGLRPREALAASLACRGAITVNMPLTPAEAVQLLTDLTGCEDPFTCPHGRPILLTFEHAELLRRFGRSIPASRRTVA